MRKPRIFISHSAREPTSGRFLTRLSGALDAAGFDVLVDRERLELGVDWRDELYTWMGLCHGAVILLSESACRADSVWVPRETSILLWRRTLDPNFLIVPVYLDSVTPEHVQGGGFQDLGLTALQAVPRGTPKRMVEAVKARLGVLKSERPATPLECVAEQMAFLLREVPEDVIGAVSGATGVELGPWSPGAEPRSLLALKLLQVSLSRAIDAIETLSAYLEEASADRLLALVAPGWVDLRAARWIPDCAKCQDSKLPVALNAKSLFSAEMYVRRASCQPPKTSWPVYTISGVHGEGAVAELAGEIERCLIRAFGLTPDPLEQRSLAARLRGVLELRNRQGKPVFIALPFSPSMAKLLPELRRALPLVTFFLLTGDDFPAAEHLDTKLVRRLEPKLEPGAEQRAQDEYDYARSVICPRR